MSRLVGGVFLSPGTSIDWSAFPGARIALIGSPEDLDPAAVVLLRLNHTTMTVDDWLALGIDPLQAGAIIGSLQAGESLSAVLDIEGNVLSVISWSCTTPSEGTGTFVVAASPNEKSGTSPVVIECVSDLLRRLHEVHGLVPPPIGGGQPQDGGW